MSFAIVLFGDGKSTLLNTNCRNSVLLHSLKRACNEVCGEEDQIDLADENGEVKHLVKSLEGYGSELIAPRERLILLRIDQPDKQGQPSKFFPLLLSAQADKAFMSNLNQVVKGKRTKILHGVGKSTLNSDGNNSSSTTGKGLNGKIAGGESAASLTASTASPRTGNNAGGNNLAIALTAMKGRRNSKGF